MLNQVNITLDQLAFRKEGANSGGEPESVLYSTLTIGGCYFHVEAFQVTLDENDCPQPGNPAYAESVEALKVLCGTNELQTMEIEGKLYVLSVYPYER